MDSIIRYLQSTMLIERVFGTGVYVAALGYFYNQIQYEIYPKRISSHFNHYLIVLCIMAFFYIPGENADLYRIRNLVNPWLNMNFEWVWEFRIISSSTPIANIFLYLCQKTRINGLLPMLSALGFYGNLFHIFKCEAKRGNRSSDSIAVTLLFIMSSGRFLEVISGIRCMLAFSIIFRFIYDEMYENKSIIRSIPFYVIAVLLHSAAIPLVALRLFFSCFEKKKNILSTILNGLLATIVLLIGIKIGEDYLDAALAAANYYLSANIYSYGWEYIIVSLSLLIILSCSWKLWKWYPEAFTNEKNIIKFLLILFVCEGLTISTYTIYHRFTAISISLSIPLVLTLLNQEENSSFSRTRKIIVIVSMMILFLASIRGNLCGYKFFLINY